MPHHHQRKIENYSKMAEPTRAVDDMLQSEPTPDWRKGRKHWGIAWELHWIGFGLAFSILAVFSLFSLIQARKKRGFGRKPFVIAVNSLLLFFGVTRASYLLIDPYGSQQNGIEVPSWFLQFLFNIAYPCLTSSFSLIFLAFLEVSKLQLVPNKLQNIYLLGSIITFQFALVLAGDIASAVDADIIILLLICQVFIIVWGFLLSASFIYSGFKVIHQVRNVEKRLQLQNRANTSKVAKVTIGTSILGIASSILQLYSLVSVYKFYAKIQEPDAWMWWTFQTCARLAEIAMACTLTYSVRRPSENKRSASFRRKLTVTETVWRDRKGMVRTPELFEKQAYM